MGLHHKKWYTVSLKEGESTLFYSPKKKLLLDLPKENVDKTIEKITQGKEVNEDKAELGQLIKTSLSVESLDLPQQEQDLGKKKLYIVAGSNFSLSQEIGSKNRAEVVSLNNFRNNPKKFIRETSDAKVLIGGWRYDSQLISYIVRHREMLNGFYCFLVGVDEVYLLKLADDFCLGCFLFWREASFKNFFEKKLVENELRKTDTPYLLDREGLNFVEQKTADLKSEALIIQWDDSKRITCAPPLPFPSCPYCSSEDSNFNFSGELVGEDSGMVNGLEIDKKEVDDINFYLSTAKLANIVPIFQKNNDNLDIQDFPQIIRENPYSDFSPWRRLTCGGVGGDREVAKAKAISESIERYSASTYNKEEVFLSSYENLDGPAPSPSEWVLFSKDQYSQNDFPYAPFTNNSKIKWTSGSEVPTGDKYYLPAPFVYTRYFHGVKEEEIGVYSSTGLACHEKKKAALISGICENIERDGCILSWLLKVPPKRVVGINDGKINRTIEAFEEMGISLEIFELSMDLKVPTVLVTGINKKGNPEFPNLLIGSACKFGLKEAILSSLEEVVQALNWKYLVKRHDGFDFGDDYENIKLFEHRALYCSKLKDLSRLDFILNTNRELNYGDDEEFNDDFEGVLDNLQELGYNVFSTDLANYGVKKMGFNVLKVLIPGLHPLYSDRKTPFLDRKRLKKASSFLDKNDINYSKQLNTSPHPFP